MSNRPHARTAARPFRWRDAAVVVIAIVVAGALAEGIARLVFPPLPHAEVREDSEAAARRREEIAEGRDFGAEGSELAGLYVYTPTGLRLRANTVAHIERHNVSGRDVEIRTNSIGYRGSEIGAKEAGRTRILFLGDSITNAGYVDEPETFVRRVEALAREGGPPLETINAGVGGVGLEDELAILVETGLGVDPDVVVLCFYLNDAIPSPAVWLTPPPTFLQKSRLVAYAMLAASHLRDRGKTDPPAEAMADLDGWLEEVRGDFPGGKGDPLVERGGFNFAIEKNFRDWGNVWSDGAWMRMEPVFREFARQASIHDFALCIVCFPHRFQVEAEFLADEPQRRLEAIAHEEDVPFLDLLPAFRAEFREPANAAAPTGDPSPTHDAALFYDQCHLTPRGNDLVAREILAFLRRSGA